MKNKSLVNEESLVAQALKIFNCDICYDRENLVADIKADGSKGKRNFICTYRPSIPTPYLLSKTSARIVVVGLNPGDVFNFSDRLGYHTQLMRSNLTNKKCKLSIFRKILKYIQGIDSSDSYKGPYAYWAAKFISAFIETNEFNKLNGFKELKDTFGLNGELNATNIYEYIYWANTWFCPSNKGKRFVGRFADSDEGWVEVKQVSMEPSEATWMANCKKQGHLKNYLENLNPHVVIFFGGDPDSHVRDYLPSGWQPESRSSMSNSKKAPRVGVIECADNSGETRLVLHCPHPTLLKFMWPKHKKNVVAQVLTDLGLGKKQGLTKLKEKN